MFNVCVSINLFLKFDTRVVLKGHHCSHEIADNLIKIRKVLIYELCGKGLFYILAHQFSSERKCTMVLNYTITLWVEF